MQNYFRRQWTIVISVIFLGLIGIGIQKLFVNNLDNKVAVCEQEQQLFVEQFNNRIAKLNKQLAFLKDENRNLKSSNQELLAKIDNLKILESDSNKELLKIQDRNLELEKTYIFEINGLKKKLKYLTQENITLNDLITELKQQLKNYRINSYSLFQAGKLELELSNLDQKLAEQYENISIKNKDMLILKEKCGKLRTNTKFCQEYDLIVNTINTLQKQISHLQEQRTELKQRINIYLSSSNKTNSGN